jgi:hypothetical protein
VCWIASIRSLNGRYLRTAVVPCAVLATCHVKPMLTLARGLEARQESRRKKILKAPLSPQLRTFGRNEDGRRVEFRELFRGWENPADQAKFANHRSQDRWNWRRRLREAATADGRRERVPWLPAPGMKAKRGR